MPRLEEWAKDKGVVVPLRKSRGGMIVTYFWDGVRRVGKGGHVGALLARAWGVAIVRTGGGNEQDRVVISVHGEPDQLRDRPGAAAAVLMHTRYSSSSSPPSSSSSQQALTTSGS